MLIIGIDPGTTDNTGLCIHDGKPVLIKSMTFWQTLRVIDGYRDGRDDVFIIVELPKTKASFNRAGGHITSVNIGMCYGHAKLWEAYCIHHKIEYKTVAPGGKIDAEKFKQITGWDKFKTNSHSRDAALMVWRYLKQQKAV